MKKVVSFNDISQLQIIDTDLLYEIETKLIDGSENQYFFQLLYVYFNCEKHIFYQFIDSDIIQINKNKYLDLFEKIINHLNTHKTYNFYKYNFKIKKQREDLEKLYNVYSYCTGV